MATVTTVSTVADDFSQVSTVADQLVADNSISSASVLQVVLSSFGGGKFLVTVVYSA